MADGDRNPSMQTNVVADPDQKRLILTLGLISTTKLPIMDINSETHLLLLKFASIAFFFLLDYLVVR